MMRVKWVGESRMIPSCGIGEAGKVLELPKEIAISYINQGLAEAVKVDKPKAKIKNVKQENI